MNVEEEFDIVCSLVNSAYVIEDGDEGVAFKKRKRYHDPSKDDEKLMKNMRETWVVEKDGRIVGCIRVEIQGSVGHIGPLAVAQECQGHGIGKLLLDFAESLTEISEIEVVSCRTDVIPMYERRGYKPVDRVPITSILPLDHLTRLDLDFIIYQKH